MNWWSGHVICFDFLMSFAWFPIISLQPDYRDMNWMHRLQDAHKTGWTTGCMENWLDYRDPKVMGSSLKFTCQMVIRGFPHRQVLELLLFHIFTIYLDDEQKHTHEVCG